ncbi:MAG TPA: ABC-2 family transporter protein [Anaerolineales bacterium]|nr:ABC-2 family transporter protein [Anaerolineales bacterium]
MKTLRHYFRIYFLIEAQYIKSRMQYRDDFIISMIGMFFSSLTTIGIFWVLFETIPELAGWTFNQLLFMYAFYLLATAPMQILFDHFWQLRWLVIDGRFLKYYFRPLNMMFYFVSEMFDIKGLTQFALGIALFIYASNQLAIQWSLLSVILLLVLLGSAALVVIGMMVMASSSAFWIYNSYPVMDLAWRLREFSPYPMTIFDGFFKVLFTYVIPIGFVAFYPSQFFLQPDSFPLSVWFSPLIGIGVFALGYWVWTKGVNSYSGTGS